CVTPRASARDACVPFAESFRAPNDRGRAIRAKRTTGVVCRQQALLEAMAIQAHVVGVEAEDVRIVPGKVRRAVVQALKEMSLEPRSSMKRAAAILDVSYEGVRKAIESGRLG